MAILVASAGLYRIVTLIVPHLTSAEPTGAGEALPWVRGMGRAAINSIQHKTHGLGYTVGYLGCCAGLFALYAVALRLPRPGRGAVAAVFAGSALLMGVLLCAPAMLSNDTYAYAHYGRMLVVQGLDAHGPVPPDGAADPFSLGGYYGWVPSVYGPLWTVISAGIVWLGNGRVGLTILLFRLLAAISVLATGGFIHAILRRLAPARALRGAALFLWNPLVLMESVLGGHNDSCMMLLAVAAVWMHVRGRKAGVVATLALSALVKVITWPLVPLYGLMALRKAEDWRARGLFVARAAVATAAAVTLSVWLAKLNPNGLTVHTASSAQFYENNYHELLFKGLRRLLGEPADSLCIPMDFKPWWAEAISPATLHEGPANKTRDICRVAAGQRLLVISDQDSDTWLRLYDPATQMQGYLEWPHLTPSVEPRNPDPTSQRLSGWPPDWPTVVRANEIIRLATWSLFILAGLLAAWRARDLESYIDWAAWFFIASELLVFTKIWPWYAIWPLAYVALRPAHAPVRMAIYLSMGMSTLYAFLDYPATRWSWLYDYRSVPTIVLPALLAAVVAFAGRRPVVSRGYGRELL